MSSKQIRSMVIFAILAALMAATRDHHFGSVTHLPDASLAVFLLAGFYLPRWSFPVLLVEAGLVDYLAINYGSVSDWCVSPAYGFLIPAYLVLWLGGRFYAAHHSHSWRGLSLFAAIAWLATSVSFVISSGSFYLFSGRFAEMGAAQYAASMAGYYVQYLAGALLYLSIAAGMHIVAVGRSGHSVHA